MPFDAFALRDRVVDDYREYVASFVLERVGLRSEGRLRENEYFKERWKDTLLFGL